MVVVAIVIIVVVVDVVANLAIIVGIVAKTWRPFIKSGFSNSSSSESNTSSRETWRSFIEIGLSNSSSGTSNTCSTIITSTSITLYSFTLLVILIVN